MNNETAFPTNTELWEPTSGMMLRDYFASHIEIAIEEHPTLAGMLMGRESPDQTNRVTYCEYWFEAEAKIRYMKADAMMKARAA